MSDELRQLWAMGELGRRVAANIIVLPLAAEIDNHFRMIAGKRGSRRGIERL